jgi:glutamyl-tRNA reductase
MHFIVVGLNHKTAPIDVRERMSFAGEARHADLRKIIDCSCAGQAALLSTCNRAEIYALTQLPDASNLKKFFMDYTGEDAGIEQHLYAYIDVAAIRHVCAVAAGLDSMVLGEPQIFGQVKDALQAAVECGAAGKQLEHLFGRIFGVVKKVRTKTKIGEFPLSVSYAAVKKAQEIFPCLENVTALIVGAGEMSELTLRNLITSGVKSIFVTNRTFQKAVELSERFGATPIMLHEMAEYLPQTDIIISSITAPEYIVTKEVVASARTKEPSKPLFMIDISVPRSIDPAAGEIENFHLYNIDDLQAIAASNAEVRKLEAEKAAAIIEEKLPEVFEFLNTRNYQPIITAIQTEAEGIRRKAVAELESFGVMSGEQKKLIETTTKSIVEQIVKHSEHRIREFVGKIR